MSYEGRDAAQDLSLEWEVELDRLELEVIRIERLLVAMKPMDQKNWVAPSPSAPMPIHLLPAGGRHPQAPGRRARQGHAGPAHDRPSTACYVESRATRRTRHRATSTSPPDEALREYWGYLSQSLRLSLRPGQSGRRRPSSTDRSPPADGPATPLHSRRHSRVHGRIRRRQSRARTPPSTASPCASRSSPTTSPTSTPPASGRSASTSRARCARPSTAVTSRPPPTVVCTSRPLRPTPRWAPTATTSTCARRRSPRSRRSTSTRCSPAP